MRSLQAFSLSVLLVGGCGQNTTHNLDNDYGNANIKLGNPSKATTDVSNVDNYLMLKPEYVLSYSKSRNLANWASWQLNRSWMGDAKRQNNFHPDPGAIKSESSAQ
ncbi:MAG: DNA/RNA non-specific endonuclease [Pseudanabaena sp. Salubria-1]|nr:DNA/RNA non-specific endonuclease [Pseudanabaena sp. Salubria-1]